MVPNRDSILIKRSVLANNNFRAEKKVRNAWFAILGDKDEIKIVQADNLIVVRQHSFKTLVGLAPTSELFHYSSDNTKTYFQRPKH